MISTKYSMPVVLGLGNPLFQDEGLGIYVIHQLMEGELAEQVELIDGGTDGLSLLGVVETAQQLLIIDAIDGGFPPGTIERREGLEIPLAAYAKVSQHQLGFQEVLGLAYLRGRLPADLVLIGVQPKALDWGTRLTATVARSVPRVKEMVYEQVASWMA